MKWTCFDAGTTLQGEGTLDSPIAESDLGRLQIRFKNDATGAAYIWQSFERVQGDEGVADFGELTDTPLKLKVGETATVAVTMNKGYQLSVRKQKVLVGDGTILSASATRENGAGTVTLKGLKPGKTTLSIIYADSNDDRHNTVPREVWVTDESGNVPGSNSSGRSGGCDVGLGVMGLLSLAFILKKKAR